MYQRDWCRGLYVIYFILFTVIGSICDIYTPCGVIASRTRNQMW